MHENAPDIAWLDALLRRAGLPPATGVQVFGGGTFNTVLRVDTGEDAVVVKVAPDPRRPVLSHEHGIMATEVLYYRRAAEHGVEPLPRMLYHGTERGTEALVLSLCPGRPWPDVGQGLDDAHRYHLRHAVGRTLAVLHAITGPGYGYPAGPLAASWRDAFIGMVGVLLADADRYEVSLPRTTSEIAAIVESVGSVLDDVAAAALVHFDLWDGNILVDLAEQPRLGGLIDAERAFWGDPVAEFVSLRLFGDLQPDAGLLAGYRAGGGRLVLDESTRLRLLLYRLYLYLIMWIEVAPRGYGGDQVARLRQKVLGPITAMLDELA